MPEPIDLDLDGALSADLDGDLPAWCEAGDHDLAAVQSRLAAPDAAARRAELTVVRDALATPVAPPDELGRRRLLGAALADADPDTTIPDRSPGTGAEGRSRRFWAVLAGVAAAVLLVVAIVAAVNGGSDGTAKSSGSATADAPTGDLGNVGALDQKGVDRLIHGGAASTPSPSSSASEASPSADGFTPAPDAVPAATVKACAERYAAQGTVRFQASGDFQGRPAVILGVDTDTRTIVFVVAADDCGTVLYSASR
jgi:hypothetical protein